MFNLLAIVGQTAAGKSALAMSLAQVLPIEILAADSRTIYKGLNIGTAKPSPADQALVKHHLLDLVEPQQSFNVADFQKLAREKIAEVQARSNLPVLVGGSGLYVDSVLFDYDFSSGRAQPELRQQLAELSIKELQAKIKARNLSLPQNALNKRYLIRTLERGSDPTKELKPVAQALMVGLALPKDVLEERIRERLKQMLDQGLLEEVQSAWALYQPESEALKGNIYQALKPYLDGELNWAAAGEDFVRRDLALAKKQLTWFKRHQQIQWFDSQSEAYQFICQKLL